MRLKVQNLFGVLVLQFTEHHLVFLVGLRKCTINFLLKKGELVRVVLFAVLQILLAVKKLAMCLVQLLSLLCKCQLIFL